MGTDITIPKMACSKLRLAAIKILYTPKIH